MAQDGEAPQLRSLNNNMRFIKAKVSGGNLQWFSDNLVEKGFIARRKAQGIINTKGETEETLVGRLMDDVCGAIEFAENKQEEYDLFVDIFSHDAAYNELVKKLRSSVATAASESEELDLQDVIIALKPLTASWRPLGLALRLSNDDLKTIAKQHSNLDDCLREMVTLWLTLKYNHEKYGVPSWEMLADAVENNAGGANPALAIKIRKNH